MPAFHCYDICEKEVAGASDENVHDTKMKESVRGTSSVLHVSQTYVKVCLRIIKKLPQTHIRNKYSAIAGMQRGR